MRRNDLSLERRCSGDSVQGARNDLKLERPFSLRVRRPHSGTTSVSGARTRERMATWANSVSRHRPTVTKLGPRVARAWPWLASARVGPESTNIGPNSTCQIPEFPVRKQHFRHVQLKGNSRISRKVETSGPKRRRAGFVSAPMPIAPIPARIHARRPHSRTT